MPIERAGTPAISSRCSSGSSSSSSSSLRCGARCEARILTRAERRGSGVAWRTHTRAGGTQEGALEEQGLGWVACNAAHGGGDVARSHP